MVKINTRVKAEKEIIEFLTSESSTMVLSGTHMFEKHKLILKLLASKYKNLKILFRVNSLKNTQAPSFLNMKVETGIPYRLGENIIYFDSMSVNSWRRTPHNFDIIIFYPAGSLRNRKSAEVKHNLEDIFEEKNVNKIIFVTCQEGWDISYLKEYDDIIHIKYDSEEDDIEYHKRVLENQCKFDFNK